MCGYYLYFRFTPTQLVRMLQLKKLNLGLVIDLTNTDRYYSWKVGLAVRCISYCYTCSHLKT